MGYCDELISQDISASCENPVVGGLESEGIIINYSDIDKSLSVFEQATTGENPLKARDNVLTKIGLKTGAKAYKIKTSPNTPFNGTVTTLTEGTNRNTFTKTVGFVILDAGPDVCDNIIDGLANGSFVVILENKFQNVNKATRKGDSTFEVFGFDQGLKATTLENDKNSEDTEGGWNVVLTETKAPRSGLYLYDTDLATTRSLVESLTA